MQLTDEYSEGGRYYGRHAIPQVGLYIVEKAPSQNKIFHIIRKEIE